MKRERERERELRFAFKLRWYRASFLWLRRRVPLARPMALLYFVFNQTSTLVPQVKPAPHRTGPKFSVVSAFRTR